MTNTAATGNEGARKWVYRFGDGAAEGDAGMKALLGGKGANLAEMSRIGLPVPPGFTISTEVSVWSTGGRQGYPPGLEDEVAAALVALEAGTGCRFGDPVQPLLVSVRSGARASMPGMMDTVLNLGLNDATVEGLATASGDPRFAWDSYRRFLQMYGDVVLGVDHGRFEEILDVYKTEQGLRADPELGAGDWRTVATRFQALVQDVLGRPFPQDVRQQLWGAITAVLRSWYNPRAQTYRRMHNIPESWGTAVTVQAMVFGNMGDDCATGVAFTRNPSTGEHAFYGEFLINAQGEDVVAGLRTPQSLTKAGRAATNGHGDLPSLEEALPGVFHQLLDIRGTLERHFRDMQDIEFTVQRGKLYMLQTRAGKRTAKAALRIAVDMAHEGLISESEAIQRVDPASLDQLLHPTLDPDAPRTVIGRGLPASPGAACGKVVFDPDEAERQAELGEAVILCRAETSPDDIHGMCAAKGILTTRGGMTSHAAVVARGMGRPCVAGAGEMRIDVHKRVMQAGSREIREGDVITLDGGSGEIMLGEVPTVLPKLSGDFATLMGWADRVRRLRVRANAETPDDARNARRFGAEGIGLCRTEHMFFEVDRIVPMRRMILAETEAERRAALADLAPMQQRDFVALFEIMAGLPVTIRLLDPPLHEFLPVKEEEVNDVAAASGVSVERVRTRSAQLHESNPMLGHRGCRLAISYPEIYEMQVRAIFGAAVEVLETKGQAVQPEIMIPLVATAAELRIMRDLVVRTAAAVAEETGREIPYQVGTMIELPRAALRAYEIAEFAEFFSFGTNDLTQTTLGLSRDDSGAFLPEYQSAGIFERDPFATLDVEGVGELIGLAAERGRRRRPEMKMGICGEHGGDPDSIRFCEQVGLSYVSCSPFRVPIARLAAAQAALAKAGQEGGGTA